MWSNAVRNRESDSNTCKPTPPCIPMRFRPSSNGDRAPFSWLPGCLPRMDGRFVGLYSVGNDMPASPHGVAETQIIRGRTGISFLLSDGHPSCSRFGLAPHRRFGKGNKVMLLPSASTATPAFALMDVVQSILDKHEPERRIFLIDLARETRTDG